MVTNSQIRIIHALKKALFMDDETYEDYLLSFGVCSSKELTNAEAKILIDSMKLKAVEMGIWKTKPLKYDELEREDMATPAQLRYIEGLWNSGSEERDPKIRRKKLRAYLQLRFKIDDIMFITKSKANSVINSIKAMQRNYKNKRVAAQM